MEASDIVKGAVIRVPAGYHGPGSRTYHLEVTSTGTPGPVTGAIPVGGNIIPGRGKSTRRSPLIRPVFPARPAQLTLVRPAPPQEGR